MTDFLRGCITGAWMTVVIECMICLVILIRDHFNN